MQCDRAQEYFSDYIEQTLDRPMTVALEGHLAGCPACRTDIEGLRAAFNALESLPYVVPPADGAWRVMRAVRESLPAPAPVQSRPSFTHWLRSLNPASAAFGAGLATLAIAGTVFVSGVGRQAVQNNLFPILNHPAAVVREFPDISVRTQNATRDGQPVELEVRPGIELPDASIRVKGVDLDLAWAGDGHIGPEKPARLSLVLPATAASAEIAVLVTSPSLHKEYDAVVVVPLAAHRTGAMDLIADRQPATQVLRQIGEYLDRPVVVENGGEAAVTMGVQGMLPEHCLDDVARQMNLRVDSSGPVYRLTAE